MSLRVDGAISGVVAVAMANPQNPRRSLGPRGSMPPAAGLDAMGGDDG